MNNGMCGSKLQYVNSTGNYVVVFVCLACISYDSKVADYLICWFISQFHTPKKVFVKTGVYCNTLSVNPKSFILLTPPSANDMLLC